MHHLINASRAVLYSCEQTSAQFPFETSKSNRLLGRIIHTVFLQERPRLEVSSIVYRALRITGSGRSVWGSSQVELFDRLSPRAPIGFSKYRCCLSFCTAPSSPLRLILGWRWNRGYGIICVQFVVIPLCGGLAAAVDQHRSNSSCIHPIVVAEVYRGSHKVCSSPHCLYCGTMCRPHRDR